MHIHHLALRVRDFEKSLHFYQTLTELKIHTLPGVVMRIRHPDVRGSGRDA